MKFSIKEWVMEADKNAAKNTTKISTVLESGTLFEPMARGIKNKFLSVLWENMTKLSDPS